MKICFVDPEGIHFGLNSGIAYIVSYLKNIHGYRSIKVFDFNNNNENIESRIKEIKSFDVIGFSIQSYTYESALNIAYKVKTKNNFLFAGGPHITLDGSHFIKTNKIFDIGVFGEGEKTTVSLLKAIESKTDFESISGIFYRREENVIFTGIPNRILDLDTLPYPEYSDFDSIVNRKFHYYPLVTSRGCPYTCIYCCVTNTMGKRWLSRSVNNIIGELRKAKEDYSFNRFNIQDDNFSLNMERAKCFCEELSKENFDLKWSCYNGIRADRIDRDLMAKMKNAGCFAISIGIESAIKKEFDTIKKGEDFSDILKAIEMAHLNQISICANFIIGLPHSNLESIRASTKFAIDMELDSCIFNLMVPFPGTEMWDWVQQNGKILNDWRKGFTIGKRPIIIFETKEFPKQDRIKAYYEANTKCRNYFAFMNRQDRLIVNIFYIFKIILQYDSLRFFNHVFWCLNNFKKIISRIANKY